MGEASNHATASRWRYGKAVPIGQLMGDLLESSSRAEPERQVTAPQLDRKETHSSSAAKARMGYVKIPRALRAAEKSFQ